MDKREKRIVVAGSSVVDLVFRTPVLDERKVKGRISLALGGKYLASHFYYLFGGGGANAATTLSYQGFKVNLISLVGPDIFGKSIVKNLRRNNIDTRLIKFKAKQTPISSILLLRSGKRTIINYRSDADNFFLSNQIESVFRKASWFMLYSLAHCPKEEKIKFLKEAKKYNLQVMLSLHSSEYKKGIAYLKDYLPYCDLLHLNAYELSDIFDGKAENFDFHKTNFAVKLNLPLLLVTYDKRGIFAYTKNRIYYQRALSPKKIVDTTGAGDVFSSSFAGEYIKTDSIPKALYFGSLNAASCIGKLGAQNGLITRK